MSGDLISRQAVKDWFCTNYCSEHNKCEHFEKGDCNAMIELFAIPPVNPQEPKTDIGKLLDKTYYDFCKCPGGESWFELDGETYSTDVGYALEGMEIFIHVLKRRMAESEDKE